MDTIVLIPAYKPDQKMLTLLSALSEQRAYTCLLVVDDGSGPEYAPVFDEAAKIQGVAVLYHGVNAGKGRALKTGLHHILRNWPDAGVVTADCDGQHTPQDIHKVALALQEHPDTFIVGGRAFTGNVPFKSRAGNAIMRTLFHLSTGTRIHDTQTGLRGLPASDLPREAGISGERYEYEMNVLLSLGAAGVPVKEIPIETVYIDGNKGSHFHPFRDAMRVFSRMIVFASASAISFGVDYGLYILLDVFFGLPNSADYAIARLLSSGVNFALNRQLVFQSKGSLLRQLVSYYVLAGIILLIGTFSVGFLTRHGINRYLAKILTDAVLYLVSFLVQRFVIFRQGPGKMNRRRMA